MAEPMSALSPEKLNTSSNSLLIEDDFDMTFHDPPSSPFVSHIETENQENVAPYIAPTPAKLLTETDDDVPQSTVKISPEKKSISKSRASPAVASPVKCLLGGSEDTKKCSPSSGQISPEKAFDVEESVYEPAQSERSGGSRRLSSPSQGTRVRSAESTQRLPVPGKETTNIEPIVYSHGEPSLRDNEGLTVAMKVMDDMRAERQQVLTRQRSHDDNLDLDLDLDNTEFNPDGPECTSLDIDDTGFSMFSEMPGLDMTKFASLQKSPTKDTCFDATPRARTHMTPSTVRRTERTPSPTPRRTYKENDTTNLLLDFTEQIQSFSQSKRNSPSRGGPSSKKSATQPDLRSYYQNQRSPAKGASCIPSTPSQSRQMLNLLDFELPPPPTPRSLPTVTIREMESVKSQFQSQISSLTASLSGKEAEIDSLAKAVADAERRVGEAHEAIREERSTREYAESQMEDWKKKGEEVQRLLQDVQSELARNDSEREQLLIRLAEAEKRAEDAENRSSELETKVIEAESRNVDMTTFISHDTEEDAHKIYSELECQAAIAEKVNEVARDLHSAYKAKHEKKIKALKDNYQRKADEKCKELRLQIIRLERQVEETERKRDDTFSKVLPQGTNSNVENKCTQCGKDGSTSTSLSKADDVQELEQQRAEIENLKAKLAGLQSELQSMQSSHDKLLDDLEAERVEKGELVAAAEQMLNLCGEKMEELQHQEDLRRSTSGTAPSAPSAAPKPPAPPQQALRNTGFLAGGPLASRPGSALAGAVERSTTTAKPSGLRAPGGFGFQGGAALNRSTSNSKSRLLSNIERMGGG